MHELLTATEVGSRITEELLMKGPDYRWAHVLIPMLPLLPQFRARTIFICRVLLSFKT